MTNFKVGDRVKAVGGLGGYSLPGGKYGKIAEVRKTGSVKVIFEGREGALMFLRSELNDLELIKENKMTEFKIGDRVKRVSNTYGVYKDMKVGDIDTIVGFNYLGNLTLKNFGEGHGKENFELAAPTMDTLQPGDKICPKYGGEEIREVVLANSNYVLTKDIYDESDDLSGYTVDELNDRYKIVAPEEKIKEVTLEEVAEAMGVEVSKLRIKE